MNYQTHDSQGKQEDRGQLIPGREPEVPTHGSISFEIGPDLWLTVMTSEWAIVHVKDAPYTWKHNYADLLAGKHLKPKP